MVITLADRKTFNKIQILHDKSPGEIRDSSSICKHNKGNLQQAQNQHQIKSRKIQSNSTKIRSKIRLSFHSIPFDMYFEVLYLKYCQSKKTTQWNQRCTNWKEVNVSLIVYISELKNSTMNLLQVINTFSKVGRYRINS